MSYPEEITNALLTVETAAAHLERIGQSQDEEFRRLLREIAQNLRLLTGIMLAVSEEAIESESAVA